MSQSSGIGILTFYIKETAPHQQKVIMKYFFLAILNDILQRYIGLYPQRMQVWGMSSEIKYIQ